MIDIRISAVSDVNGPITSYYVLVATVLPTEEEKAAAGMASPPLGYWRGIPVNPTRYMVSQVCMCVPATGLLEGHTGQSHQIYGITGVYVCARHWATGGAYRSIPPDIWYHRCVCVCPPLGYWRGIPVNPTRYMVSQVCMCVPATGLLEGHTGQSHQIYGITGVYVCARHWATGGAYRSIPPDIWYHRCVCVCPPLGYWRGIPVNPTRYMVSQVCMCVPATGLLEGHTGQSHQIYGITGVYVCARHWATGGAYRSIPPDTWYHRCVCVCPPLGYWRGIPVNPTRYMVSQVCMCVPATGLLEGHTGQSHQIYGITGVYVCAL